MADQTQDDTPDYFKKPKKESSAANPDGHNPIGQKPQGESTQEDKKCKSKKLDDTIPNIENWEKVQAVKSNRIAERANWINIFLFLITLFTFFETKRSVDITEKALADARSKDSAMEIRQIKRDSLDSIKTLENRRSDSFFIDNLKKQNDLYKAQIDNGSKKDSMNTKLEKENLTVQRDYTSEIKKQFRNANESFLGIDSISVFYKKGGHIRVNFRIRAEGRGLVILRADREFIATQSHVPNIKSLDSIMLTDTSKYQFFIYNTPQMFTTKSPDILSSKIYDGIKEGKLFIYFGCVYKYEDIITKESKLFEYMARLENKEGSSVFTPVNPIPIVTNNTPLK